MDLDTFRALRSPEGERLLARVRRDLESGVEPLTLATRLRSEHPGALVAAAMTQTRLRARATAKFGADAQRMYFTPEGLEQATRADVAELRARRYRERRCVDVCCGVGGDLLALARAGCRVDGVDRDPLAVEVAHANATALELADRIEVRLADAESVDVGAYDASFCDPARRHGRGRVFDPRAYSPPLQHALELVRRTAGGGVKVAPGIPHSLVPDGSEAEWVSDGGEVKEAVLWIGALAGPAARRATLLPSGATLAEDAGSGHPPVAAPRRYLYEPDGAVIRAGLVGEAAGRVDGALLDPTIAYFTSERAVRTPFARTYEVTDVVPFSLKRLRALLRERRVGTVAIKKRGSAVDVERLRHDLRLSGPESATVVLTRLAGAHHALLCRPLDI